MGIATEHPVCPFVLVGTVGGDGIVGTYSGAQARDVLFSVEQWNAMRNGGGAAEPAAFGSDQRPDSNSLG